MIAPHFPILKMRLFLLILLTADIVGSTTTDSEYITSCQSYELPAPSFDWTSIDVRVHFDYNVSTSPVLMQVVRKSSRGNDPCISSNPMVACRKPCDVVVDNYERGSDGRRMVAVVTCANQEGLCGAQINFQVIGERFNTEMVPFLVFLLLFFVVLPVTMWLTICPPRCRRYEFSAPVSTTR